MNLQGRKMYENCIALVLTIAILVSSVFVLDLKVYAANNSTGTVTATSLNLRSGIGTSYGKVATLGNGEIVKILDIGYDSDGSVWYHVEREDGTQGWASGAYLSIKIDTDDFDLYFKLSGFPSTYYESLKALHEKYPNWIFEPQHAGVTWEAMITAQTKLGMSLTHKSNPSSWKSVQNGAYNWSTSEWIQLDSGGWVAASKELVEHYVDPRNFLTDASVFQFLKQSYDASVLTEEELASVKAGLENMVKKTFLAGECVETDETYGEFTTYVDIIMEAGKQSKVSPYVIASMIIQEQGNSGGGSSISGTVAGYEGYYNFLNIKAWEHSGNSAVVNGLIYAKQRGWNTKTKSIIECAIYFGEGYINIGQDTMYLKKFDLVDTLYTHQYMTNIQGADSEGKHIAKAYKDAETGLYTEEAQSTALVFKIPVFSNMPETPAPLPTGDGSPNYMLKDLSVEGKSLTPTFSMYDTEYELIVGNENASVNIAATPQHAEAKVEGTGKVDLAVGENKVEVKVIAANGTQRVYTIIIIREQASAEEPEVPVEPEQPGIPEEPVVTPDSTLSSEVYKVSSEDGYITGIKSFPVNAEAFQKNFVVTDGTIKVFAADGSELSGNVSTGTIVKLYNNDGKEKATYTVIIYGDANGDGIINAKDLLAIQKNNIQAKALTGVYLIAADVTRDGKVNAKDLLMVQKNNIKVSTIEQ